MARRHKGATHVKSSDDRGDATREARLVRPRYFRCLEVLAAWSRRHVGRIFAGDGAGCVTGQCHAGRRTKWRLVHSAHGRWRLLRKSNGGVRGASCILRTHRNVRRLYRLRFLVQQELPMDYAFRHHSAGKHVVSMQFRIHRAAAGRLHKDQCQFPAAAVLQLRLGE